MRFTLILGVLVFSTWLFGWPPFSDEKITNYSLLCPQNYDVLGNCQGDEIRGYVKLYRADMENNQVITDGYFEPRVYEQCVFISEDTFTCVYEDKSGGLIFEDGRRMYAKEPRICRLHQSEEFCGYWGMNEIRYKSVSRVRYKIETIKNFIIAILSFF